MTERTKRLVKGIVAKAGRISLRIEMGGRPYSGWPNIQDVDLTEFVLALVEHLGLRATYDLNMGCPHCGHYDNKIKFEERSRKKKDDDHA